MAAEDAIRLQVCIALPIAGSPLPRPAGRRPPVWPTTLAR
jgi:hypothetical protein